MSSKTRWPSNAVDGRLRSGDDLWDASPRTKVTLRSLADGLRSSIIPVASGALLCAMLVVLVGRLALTSYSATALIMVDPRNVKLPQGQEVLPGYGSDPFAIESVVQLAKSDAFYSSVLETMEREKSSLTKQGSERLSALDRLKRAINVSRRGATYLIEVIGRDSDPKEAEKLANGAAQVIVDEQLRLRSASTDKALKWLDDRTSELKVKLRKSEDAAAALKSSMRLTDAGQGFTLQERKLADLNQQLVLASAQTAEARARRDRLRNPSSTAFQDQQNALLLSLQQDLARASRNLTDRLTALGERHPEIASLRSQVSSLRAQVTAEERSLRVQAEAKLAEAESREASLAKQLADEQDRSGTQSRDYVSLAELEREAKSDRAVFEQLLTRRKELEDSKSLELPDVRIAARAIEPNRSTGPGVPLLALTGALIGGLAGVGFAVARSAGLPSQVRALRSTANFGIDVPFVREAGELARRDIRLPEFRSAFSKLADVIEGREVIAVVAARQGTGCSTTSYHLAAELARRSFEVLLIETDEQTWSTEPLRFSARAMAGRSGLWRHPFSNAAVLPAAAWNDANGESRGHITLREINDLLSAALREFDRVVVDCGSVQDGLSSRISRQADWIVYINPSEAFGSAPERTTVIRNNNLKP